MESLSKLSQYGPIGLIASIFAVVIVVLFKQLRAEARERIEDHKTLAGALADERAKSGIEREALRAEYEEKHRDIVEDYAKAMHAEREAGRSHEDLVRREFAELMEIVSAEAARSSDATVAVLSKFYDRFVSPRDRRR